MNVKAETNLTKEHSKEPKQHKVLNSKAVLYNTYMYHSLTIVACNSPGPSSYWEQEAFLLSEWRMKIELVLHLDH